MNNTNDITASFGTLYHPKSALVFYEAKGENTDVYVEHFDMDKNGSPINAHPLSEREANVLAKALQTEKDKDKAFLKPNGILQTNILHINPNTDKGARSRHPGPGCRCDHPAPRRWARPRLWIGGRRAGYPSPCRHHRWKRNRPGPSPPSSAMLFSLRALRRLGAAIVARPLSWPGTVDWPTPCSGPNARVPFPWLNRKQLGQASRFL